MEKGHIYVDITAAMEYAKAHINDYAMRKANKHLDSYNATHKRKIKEPSVDDLSVNFEGLMFGYACYFNGTSYGDSGNWAIPIDDFIVNVEE